MPSILTSIFDPADGGTSGHQSETAIAAATEQDLSVDQQIGLDVGIGYEGMDGSSHEMTLENDIGLTLNAGAAVDAVLSSNEAAMDL